MRKDELKNELSDTIKQLKELQESDNIEDAHMDADIALKITIKILGKYLGVSKLTNELLEAYDDIDKRWS